MNDKLINLLRQSEVDITHLKHFKGHIDIEKFAELIVRECEKVSLQSSHRDDDMGSIIAGNIKKHFGIQ